MNKTQTQEIIELYDGGLKPKEISRKLDCYDSTVYSVINNYKKERRLKELELIVKPTGDNK